MDPLVAVTTFCKKAFCLAANSGSRERDDLLEVETGVVVVLVVVLLRVQPERKVYLHTAMCYAAAAGGADSSRPKD